MTKPLDPEIKALRAIARALEPLRPSAQKRSLEWAVAFCMHSGGYRLPPFPPDPESTR